MKKTKDITWDLTELHDSILPESLDPLLESIQSSVQAFVSRYKGRVATVSAKELHEGIVEYERMVGQLSRLRQFAHLNYAVDTVNSTILALVSKIDEAYSMMQNEWMFFFLEIGSADSETLNTWRSDPVNQSYKYALTQAVKKNRYRLSEKEEQWINLKDLNGCDALRKLYGEHTSKYTFSVTIDGESQSMNGTQCRALRYHQDPAVRRAAMKTFYAAYEQDAHIMTHLFNTIIKDGGIEREKRGYSTAIEPMNITNDLPNKLVDMLHDITTESNALVQRYYRLKQQVLGLSTMTLADIYAPMTDDVASIDWDDAKQLVLNSFQAFDAEFYAFSMAMFEKNRIHAFPSNVKRGGAFCSSSEPGVLPFVMLNHLGKPRDVSTMAHELGHAIHAMYSKEQSLINYHAILPICETASVFCEMLVGDALKQTCQTPIEKMVLLSNKLEDMFATSHRQNMFSRFEQRIHAGMLKGRLSSNELCTIYVEELTKMFGDSVQIPDEYRWEWATIPHMLDVPFYVYSYNFGHLLVLGLYQLYLEQGTAFIPKLKRLLQAGASISPVELLASEGIDITTDTFWRKSVSYIDAVVDEFEGVVTTMECLR